MRFLRIAFIFFAFFATEVMARGGGGCFLPDTPILKADGTSIPINQIKQGDHVFAYDSNGKLTQTEVNAILQHQVTEYFQVSTNKVVVNVTGEHPFFMGTGIFKTVETLHVGEFVFGIEGNRLSKQIITKIEKFHKSTLVYNLQTDVPHTYFAATLAVHNKGGGGGGGGGGGFHGGYSSVNNAQCAPSDTQCINDARFFLIMVVIGFTIAAWIANFFKNSDELDYLNSRSNINRKAIKTTKLLNFLAKQDPEMDPIHLANRTRDVFTRLQKCWMLRNYDPMKELLMTDLYLQHCRQLEGMRKNHEVNQIANIHVTSIDLVNVRYTEKPEQREFTALISAMCSDYYIDDRNLEYLRGNKDVRPFQEFWTFEWQTNNWLLRDIEQARESDYLKQENFVEMFTDLQISKIYGDDVDNLGKAGPALLPPVAQKENKVDRMLNFLVTTNKLWDKQAMVNRARTIFTQVHLSFEAGSLSAETENLLYPDIATEMRSTLMTWNMHGNTIEYRNFCIRKVEIVLVKNFSDAAQNEFVARISAHAQTIRTQNNIIIAKDPDVTVFIEYWEFGQLNNEWRLKNAKPDSDNDILNAENIDQDSSPNLVKWYYTQKRAF